MPALENQLMNFCDLKLVKSFNKLFKSYSLRRQILLSIAGLTIFTATAVGLTALQINYRYLEKEKRSQSLLTMQDFYQSQEHQLTNMTILAASRPTLAEYLNAQDYPALGDYLRTLNAGMVEIDAITVCDVDDHVVATSDTECSN